MDVSQPCARQASAGTLSERMVPGRMSLGSMCVRRRDGGRKHRSSVPDRVGCSFVAPLATSEVLLTYGDDPPPVGPEELAVSAPPNDGGLQVSNPGPVAEAKEDARSTAEDDIGSDQGGPSRLAERGSSDYRSDARQLHTGQFTDSIGFQAELVEVAWQGPLPPPEQLAEYEKIVPGAAMRILAMAEAAISGPIQNTAKLTDAEIEASRRGLTFAIALTSVMSVASIVFFILAVVGAGSTAACITAASVCLSIPVVLLVRAFITRS
jgi:uncharacterized membrane protein